ncbi:MAG: argininosuccinate lyase [Candidatus Aminicenantes bacterium]|nr:argininosuccinate lyase [Candidatus Aminicenantes bacterium]
MEKYTMKLWYEDKKLDPGIEKFTVGGDTVLDQKLLKYDCKASIIHARMLERNGILSAAERQELETELENLSAEAQTGGFFINPEDEDGHTAIENRLRDKLGVVGEKIHTGRSRNDQVLTALRLYIKDELLCVKKSLKSLIGGVRRFSNRWGRIEMPGFTHTRKAMPSSVGMWAEALVEALYDDLDQWKAAYALIDQSPLGSGAGYGIPLDIDRNLSASLLGFSRVQKNPVSCQNSRGKFEGTVLHLLGFIMFDLHKTASDLVFFTLPDLGFFEIPEDMLTGSSIMPHKRNPDALEILRGYYHVVLSYEFRVKSLGAGLISGYHRDFQLMKEPVIQAFEIVRESLFIAGLIFRSLKAVPGRCKAAMTGELYTVEKAYRLVQQGIPFREAYRMVAEEWNKKR